MSTLSDLRPHQAQSLDGLRDALRTGARRVVLQAPTGFGKTVVGAHITAGVRQRSKRICFAVPSLSLIEQTFNRFTSNGFDASDIGVIQSDHPLRRPHAPIQIAMAQTLSRRELPITDLVVVDECHMRFDVYDRWMAEHPEMIFVGLSATPWAKGMGQKWQRLVKSASLRDLIRMGWASQFRVFAPSHPEITGIKTVTTAYGTDFHEGQAAKRMMKPQLIADVVDNWLARGEGRPTLCFASNLEHARAIKARFAEFGIAVALVDADTPGTERDAIGRSLQAGHIRVAINVGTLTTGVDWDFVSCLILARLTKSEMLFVQIFGRGLRPAEGKKDLLFFDHSGTHERLGYVTDIDYDELDDADAGKRAKRQEKRVSQLQIPLCCPSCVSLMPVGERVCGECGHVMPLREPVRCGDGDLTEFKGKAKPKRKKDALAEFPKAEVYAQLLFIQAERGRSEGWVAHAFKEIYEVWPRGMRDVLPKEPTWAIRQFVRAKDIRFAKSRKAVAA
jgi:superfamily II DNA or RNA helicase